MRKTRIAAAVLLSQVGIAHAQSSVTLYGIIDYGVNYISNDAGKSNWVLNSGVYQYNRWGLKGNEDLGGGLQAIFTLEGGFSGSGAMANGGRLFGRLAWVGLSSPTYGTVTLGRQASSLIDFTQVLSGIPFTGLGHAFDNDNLDNSFRFNNTIKYMSPTFAGITFGGMYGFSNSTSADATGGFGVNRMWSVGAGYKRGALTGGIAYMRLDAPNSTAVGAVAGDYINLGPTSALGSLALQSPIVRQEVLSAGINYQLSKVRLGFLYSHSQYTTAGNTLKFDNYDVNLRDQITVNFSLSGSYTFTDGKLSASGASPKYHQVSMMGDYAFSKRTDVYLMAAYQHAAGDAPVAAIAPDTFGSGGSYAPDASSSKNQTLVRVGVLHKF